MKEWIDYFTYDFMIFSINNDINNNNFITQNYLEQKIDFNIDNIDDFSFKKEETENYNTEKDIINQKSDNEKKITLEDDETVPKKIEKIGQESKTKNGNYFEMKIYNNNQTNKNSYNLSKNYREENKELNESINKDINYQENNLESIIEGSNSNTKMFENNKNHAVNKTQEDRPLIYFKEEEYSNNEKNNYLNRNKSNDIKCIKNDDNKFNSNILDEEFEKLITENQSKNKKISPLKCKDFMSSKKFKDKENENHLYTLENYQSCEITEDILKEVNFDEIDKINKFIFDESSKNLIERFNILENNNHIENSDKNLDNGIEFIENISDKICLNNYNNKDERFLENVNNVSNEFDLRNNNDNFVKSNKFNTELKEFDLIPIFKLDEIKNISKQDFFSEKNIENKEINLKLFNIYYNNDSKKILENIKNDKNKNKTDDINLNVEEKINKISKKKLKNFYLNEFENSEEKVFEDSIKDNKKDSKELESETLNSNEFNNLISDELADSDKLRRFSSKPLSFSSKYRDDEIKYLNDKLFSYKNQNKIILEENKKLLEIINIFKILQNLENSKNPNINSQKNYENREKKNFDKLSQSKNLDIIDINNKQDNFLNNKINEIGKISNVDNNLNDLIHYEERNFSKNDKMGLNKYIDFSEANKLINNMKKELNENIDQISPNSFENYNNITEENNSNRNNSKEFKFYSDKNLNLNINNELYNINNNRVKNSSNYFVEESNEHKINKNLLGNNNFNNLNEIRYIDNKNNFVLNNFNRNLLGNNNNFFFNIKNTDIKIKRELNESKDELSKNLTVKVSNDNDSSLKNISINKENKNFEIFMNYNEENFKNKNIYMGDTNNLSKTNESSIIYQNLDNSQMSNSDNNFQKSKNAKKKTFIKIDENYKIHSNKGGYSKNINLNHSNKNSNNINTNSLNNTLNSAKNSQIQNLNSNKSSLKNKISFINISNNSNQILFKNNLSNNNDKKKEILIDIKIEKKNEHKNINENVGKNKIEHNIISNYPYNKNSDLDLPLSSSNINTIENQKYTKINSNNKENYFNNNNMSNSNPTRINSNYYNPNTIKNDKILTPCVNNSLSGKELNLIYNEYNNLDKKIYFEDKNYHTIIEELERFRDINKKIIENLEYEKNTNEVKIDYTQRKKNVKYLEEILNSVNNVSTLNNQKENRNQLIPFYLIDKRKLFENMVNYLSDKKLKN